MLCRGKRSEGIVLRGAQWYRQRKKNKPLSEKKDEGQVEGDAQEEQFEEIVEASKEEKGFARSTFLGLGEKGNQRVSGQDMNMPKANRYGGGGGGGPVLSRKRNKRKLGKRAGENSKAGEGLLLRR